MKTITIAERPANIGAGVVLLLSADQYQRRRHQCEVLDDDDKGTQVRVRLTAPTQFKIGERFGYDGEVPKGLLIEADDAPPAASKPAKAEKASKAALEKARDEGFAEGRAQMLAEIRLRNQLLDEQDAAEAVLDAAKAALAAGDAADRKALEAAVAEAQKAFDTAAAKVAELPDLEG